MSQFRYPGKLDEKHPVVTRISIIKRFSLLGDIATSDTSAFSQQFAGVDGALAAAASEKNKKIVGEWKLFFYFRKKSTYINFYKIYFYNLFFKNVR